MKLGYSVQKVFRKIFNRPCVSQSRINKSARIDVGSIVVDTSMDRYSYIGEHSSVLYAEIGSFTCISNYCAIGGGSHPIDWVSVSPVFNTTKGIIKKKLASLEYTPFQKVHIGNDVWVGSHVLIKSGVSISDGAVIGMGAVVTKDVGPYEIWAGNPARLIRKRFDAETITKLLKIEWWNWEDELIEKYAEEFMLPENFINKLEDDMK